MNWLLRIALLAFISQTTQADQAAWYQVEMMMFTYQNPDMIDEESWPVPEQKPAAALTPPTSSRGLDGLGYVYAARYRLANAIAATGLPVAAPLAWLNPAGAIRQNSLAWHAKKMSRQNDMTVVWHETWVEPVQSKKGAAIHPINLAVSGTPEVHITGGFSLNVSRYLHVSTDLTVRHIGQIQAPHILTPPETAFPTATSDKPLPTTQATATQRGILRYAHVAQSRRMRSRELHYIDHPLMGILIKLTPIKLPAPSE